MKQRRSVIAYLAIGLMAIGTFAAATLCAAVLLEYGFTFNDMSNPVLLAAAWHEMVDHVGLPLVVAIAPALIATHWLIRHTFSPLERAARQIEETRAGRGVRVPTDDMPAEALPFVDSVNHLLARLDEVAAQQEAFASDVAHELRTPLTILSMELERPEALDPERLHHEVMAMRRLVDQLLLLAQINAEAAAPLPPTSFALAALAEDVAALTAPQVIAAGRTIELRVIDTKPQVRGHREAVAAALRNLVENAARASPVGSEVRITCGPGPTLRVGDEGPGLQPADLARLVARHARADHPSVEGAGLGLAIADRIMAAHGGRLWTDFAAREIAMTFPEN